MASRSSAVRLCAVALTVLTACGGSEPTADSGDKAASTSSTLHSPDGSPGGGQTATTNAAGTTALATRTSRPGGSSPAVTPAPEPTPEEGAEIAGLPPTKPPRDGTYRYTTKTGGSESTNEFVVSTLGTSDPTRQKFELRVSQGVEVQEVTWSASDLVLDAQQKRTTQQEGPRCDWEPDVRLLALPLAAGAATTHEGSCNALAAGKPVTGKLRVTVRVVGAERVAVGGTTVAVAVVERQARQETLTAGILVVETRTSTERFAPGLGLTVSSDSRSETTVNGESREPSSFHRDLVSPDPD